MGPPAVLEQLRDAGVSLQLVQAGHSFDERLNKVNAAAQASQQVQKAAPAKAPRVMCVMAQGGKVLQPSLVERAWGAVCEKLPRQDHGRSWLAFS